MKVKRISGAAVTDLGTKAPFLPNYTVVVINTTDNADTIQFSSASTGPFSQGTVIPANSGVEVEVKGRYAAIENGAGDLIVLAD